MCVCYISRTGTRKQRPRERGSIRWLQSGSAKALSVEALCICRVEFSQHNVDSGMLGCQGEGCGMIMVHGLEFHDTLLLACQRHRVVAYFSSKMTFKRSRRIFFQYISLLAQLAFLPLPLASSAVE